ncbi:MAG: DNA repair protein RadA [Nitrosomonadaceae bacterium]|nr:DNA repair protein RadA [Nitrosomonadaceae bacterium]
MKKTTKTAPARKTSKTVKPAAVKRAKAAPKAVSGRLAAQVSAGRFCDIKVPQALRTVLKTGDEYIDSLFTGDGIRPSTCCMITGLPGGGKTTISLQMANSLVKQGHVVLYNSCEESDAQVYMKLEKMGMNALIDENSTNAYFSSFYEVADIIAFADKIRKQHKFAAGQGFFLFVDSLQTIEYTKGGRGRPAGPAQQQCDAMWDIAAWCKENMTIAMIIGQVTKDGTFAGKQEVKHAVDCHLHLAMDTDKKSETYRQRIAEMQKNRFGATGLYFPYEINSTGIVFSQ